MTSSTTHPNISLSIDGKRTVPPLSVIRYLTPLCLVIAALGVWQPVWACSPAAPYTVILQDDTPDCVVVEETLYDSITVENGCGGDLTLVVNEGYGTDGTQSMSIIIEEGDAASIHLTPLSTELTWTLVDGQSGTKMGMISVETHLPETDCGDLPFGCDTMATDDDPLTSVFLFLAVGLVVMRRRITGGPRWRNDR